MIGTWLINMESPIMAFGGPTRGRQRLIGTYPSQSALTGMLGSARGMDRTADFSQYQKLRFGCRVDREPTLMRDFCALFAGMYRGKPYFTLTASGKKRKDAILVNKWYMEDPKFLVGIEGDIDFLKLNQAAFYDPANTLFYGRRNCLVGLTPDRIVELPLERALQLDGPVPWKGREDDDMPEYLRFVLPVDDCYMGSEAVEVANDVLLGYDSQLKEWRYGSRCVINAMRSTSM